MHYILTQYPVTIDLSPRAMKYLDRVIANGCDMTPEGWDEELQCEIDNFVNLLQNLLERTDNGNLDLIGG